MISRALASLPILAVIASLSGCVLAGDDAGASADDVKLDTATALARRQYDANVAFANAYRARCQAPAGSTRPRALVTGYGRFLDVDDNASGRVVEALVGARYPATTAPAYGEIDPPDAQVSVTTTTLHLPSVGDVDVCGMILPVYWDLAAVLVARELESFGPSFVMMNGVAGFAQPLWIELGSTNRAEPLDDGSGRLRPAASADGNARILRSVPASDDARPNLLSWTRVRSAAVRSIDAHADVAAADGTRFGDVVQGALFAGFPRASNTYLCNDITYVTSYLMDHLGQAVKVLEASVKSRRAPNEVKVVLRRDFRAVPRVFVHWPTSIVSAHRAAAADVARSMLDAQLSAWYSGDPPTRGDSQTPDPSLPAGDTY